MNATLHPIPSLGIVDWMLWRWQVNPANHLVIILDSGDGEKAMSRMRVAISRLRKTMQRQGIKDIQQFGINHHVSVWTEEDGRTFDALYVNRFVHSTHQMKQLFATADFSFKKANES